MKKFILVLLPFLFISCFENSSQNKEKYTKPPINQKENIEKKQLTPSQKIVIEFHLKIYEKLSENATNGDELEIAEKKADKLTCKTFNITEKQLEQIFDIYNFGYILEKNK